MSVFTKYTTIKTAQSGKTIKAPTSVIESVYNKGYHITTSSNGRYATVYQYNKRTQRAEYIAPLSYFISDRIAGYKDGNGCNLIKSNLIMMKD